MELKLIECNQNYWKNIWEIRNFDKQGFIDQKEIPIEEHFEFMKKHNSNYKICLKNNEFVGFIGLVNNDLRIAVSKEFKRKGIGKFMVNEFCKNLKINEIKVKIDNDASQKLFESCGYKKEFLIYSKNET
jgi:ribosomal protein S18 acetylase RimI-like enzyme